MGETANTTPTLRDRVANLVLAADNAPSFGGLRQHLTEAAGFAVAVVERLEFDEKTGTDQAVSVALLVEGLKSTTGAIEAIVGDVQALQLGERARDEQIRSLTESLAKSEGDFAELLAKLAEIEARLQEA